MIIPDFGGIITNYGTASIHPVSNFLTPPVKQLAFNESLRSNDGLLINAVAVGEGVSVEEATSRVKYFVKKLTDQLKRNETVKLEGVGDFLYNEEEHVQFVSDKSVNYLEESFGLTELYFKPIDREEEDMKRIRPTQGRPVVRKAPMRKSGAKAGQKVDKKTAASNQPEKEQPEKEQLSDELVLSKETVVELKKQDTKEQVIKAQDNESKIEEKEEKKKEAKSLLFLIIPVILILSAGGIYYYTSLQKQEEIDIAVVDGEDTEVIENTGEASVVGGITGDVIDATTETSTEETFTEEDADVSDEVKEPAVEETIPTVTSPNNSFTSSSGNTYVIAGVFQQKRKADRYARQFSNGEVLNHDGMYRVSIARYNTKSEARQNISSLKAEHGENLWILER